MSPPMVTWASVAGGPKARARKPKTPFYRYNSSPEIIRLAVMLYTKYPLSLLDVEDFLAERGVNICHETVRFWRNRSGPMFAAEIRKRRIEAMRGSTHFRMVRHQDPRQGRGLEFHEETDEAPCEGAEHRHRRPSFLRRRHEGHRKPRAKGDRPAAQQQG